MNPTLKDLLKFLILQKCVQKMTISDTDIKGQTFLGVKKDTAIKELISSLRSTVLLGALTVHKMLDLLICSLPEVKSLEKQRY